MLLSGLVGGVVPSSADVSGSTAMQVGRKKKTQTRREVRPRGRLANCRRSKRPSGDEETCKALRCRWDASKGSCKEPS